MLGGCWGLLLRDLNKTQWRIRKVQMLTESVRLRTAISNYSSTFGNFTAKKNPEIVAALTGGNPRKIVFLELDKTRLDASGEYLDYWHTPYQIEITASNLAVRSAGPNRVFGDRDDIRVLEDQSGMFVEGSAAQGTREKHDTSPKGGSLQ